MKEIEYKTQAQKEFDIAWQEFFKNKPNPQNEAEEKKQLEDFNQWYNYTRKQTDTGKTPAEMYEEVYGKAPPKKPVEISRIMGFEWDEDYDEESIGLIEELKEYDNNEGSNYENMRKKAEPVISKIKKKEEKILNSLYELLENEKTWSCLFALEILKEMKNPNSILYLIRFIEKNAEGDYFENCEIAMRALIDMGEHSVESIINSLEEGLKNKVYKGYLFEALSEIKDKRGKEFRLRVLKDYLDNPKKYQRWFDLTMFICGFNEGEREALPFLKQLKETDLNEEEKRELESAIEAIEYPEEYKKKLEKELGKFKPLIQKLTKKIPKKCTLPL